MKRNRTKPVSLEALWEDEVSHPVVRAPPRASAEARLIADPERTKLCHCRRSGATV